MAAYPKATFPLTTVGFGLFDDWTDYSDYEKAFRAVIENCGGWDAFKEKIEGMNVVIKPVAMGFWRKIPPKPEEPGGGETLSPHTIRAVAKVALEAKPAKLTIWSNGPVFAPFEWLGELGFFDATKDLEGVEWYNGAGTAAEPEPVVKLTTPRPIISTTYYWPELPVKEADTIISIAVAKCHSCARSTGNIKNLAVSGAPPQVYVGGSPLVYGKSPDFTEFYSSEYVMDYYEDVRKPYEKTKGPPEERLRRFLELGANLRGRLHFQSYVDWLNKFKGALPRDLPLRILSMHAEFADNFAAAYYGTKVKNWMGVVEFTKGLEIAERIDFGGKPVDYKGLTPIKKYFLIGGYDLVATDTIEAMCLGWMPWEIEHPHTDLRYLQWSAMHGLGTYRLSEIEVKGIDDLFDVNANVHRGKFWDATTDVIGLPGSVAYVPPDKRETKYLDQRTPYID